MGKRRCIVEHRSHPERIAAGDAQREIDGSAGGHWAGFGGQHPGMRTEVRVYDPNTTTLTAQTEPNTP